MKTIWKAQLRPQIGSTVSTIDIPANSIILSVGEQHGDVSLWFQVDDQLPIEQRVFEVIGTGHEIKEEPNISKVYVGRADLMSGNLILHIFEHFKKASI